MYKPYGKVLFQEMITGRRRKLNSMTEPTARKKHPFLKPIMIVIATALIISPSYVVEYLMSHGKLSISLSALVSLAMFLVGAFLMVSLLRE
jgi:hydrogenase-4 membrane subunit HyfE